MKTSSRFCVNEAEPVRWDNPARTAFAMIRLTRTTARKAGVSLPQSFANATATFSSPSWTTLPPAKAPLKTAGRKHKGDG